MQKNGAAIVYSPTDLTTFVDSRFASWMARLALDHNDRLPAADAPDGLMTLLAERGFAHETGRLALFRAEGKSIREIPADGSHAERAAATRAALHEGADVIYQAYLESAPFAGVADFLVKVPGQSALGDWHYVVWDTKLSSAVKPAYLLQMCCYAEMLEPIQQRLPGTLTVALGNGDDRPFQTTDCLYYYQCIKADFLQSQADFRSDAQPDPADSDAWGRWSTYANGLLLDRDHLIQVANIRKSQIGKLNAAGIATMHQLADLPLGSDIKGINAQALAKLRSQAAIQCASESLERPLYDILRAPGQGLELLPPPSTLDIFFDIEGFPLEKGGLEYLWGSTYFGDDKQRQFIDFWAHDAQQEKQCFADFIEWAYARWLRDPGMHIYHYASYEITACRKLMGRHGICEMEVDQLLRNEVFVDLYKVVKGCLLLGEPRYSIKNVEHLYRPKRSTEVANGGDSVVVYDAWRTQFSLDNAGRMPLPDAWKRDKSLADIRAYNKDDCDSTQELADWLREQQRANGICFGSTAASADETAPRAPVEPPPLHAELLAMAARERSTGAAGIPLAETMAWLLEFHRRENPPMFWRKFDRLGNTENELFDDLDCISGCRRSDRAPFKSKPSERNFTYEYRFDPNQECKGLSGNYYVLEAPDTQVMVVSIDSSAGRVLLKTRVEPPARITLIPNEFVSSDPIPGAIERVAQAYLDGAAGTCAILDFLQRRPPRIAGIAPGQPIVTGTGSGERMAGIIAAVSGLKQSCLTIQGPPGTGKTYTASHVIAELMRNGKKVGISSNSHKAINNLLIRTAEVCRKQGIKAAFACTRNTDAVLEELGVTILDNTSLAEWIRPGCVAGTTAWGFCREELEKQFDYLFVDEAGQVSVANLVGMSNAADNIVLIGDQMQLGQPTQGTHPGESGMSTLDYLMGEQATIADDRGIFLDTTSRMHPAVNRFISDAIYEGRLKSADGNERQVVRVPGGYVGALDRDAGIVIVPVRHEGNSQASDEETEEIAALVAELLGRTVVDKHGVERKVGWDDMLFVAPYNFQVNKLTARLARLAGGADAKVGTVDRFQGQEAAIVFVSMCSSDANDSPRGMDFLFDEHRLNVAVSRAQSLAVVVMHPALVTTKVSNPEQMRKVNLLARLFLLKHASQSARCSLNA
jgi:predicted RecB family nuclease